MYLRRCRTKASSCDVATDTDRSSAGARRGHLGVAENGPRSMQKRSKMEGWRLQKSKQDGPKIDVERKIEK